MEDNFYTIIITLATVLGSAGAWKFYEKKMKIKHKNDENERSDHNLYRDDLRNRVRKLEDLLKNSSKEKDEMRDQILVLTEEVAQLRTKVTFLERENQRLKNV
jgi:TolA-binding protein